jgi:hypothetical protein
MLGEHRALAYIAYDRLPIGKGHAIEQDGIAASLIDQRRDDRAERLGMLFLQGQHQLDRDLRLIGQ